MSFASYSFLLIFLPLTVFLYHITRLILGDTKARLILTAGSLLFCYLAGRLNGILFLSLSISLNYILARNTKESKPILIIGIILNCLILCLCKYIFPNIKGFILPLGISFYTFQNIELLVSAYRKEIDISGISITYYLFYETYFPKLAQGPITPPAFFFSQLNKKEEKNINWEKLSKGLFLFSIGLVKKTMLADRFGQLANLGFSSVAELNTVSAAVTVFAYTIQIYFDFSGYSDMALGISNMLGLNLPVNFNSPYKATSISDFWKRWHITLTNFLTRYVYIPLGGNRKGKIRTYLNILIVFLVSGIWHGTGMNFIIWGLMHGLAMVLHRWFKTTFKKIKIPAILGWFFTMAFVVISWIFFRSASVSDAILIIKKILELDIGSVPDTFLPLLQPGIAKYLIPQGMLRYAAYALLDLVIPLYAMFISKNSNELAEKMKPNIMYIAFITIMFAAGICSLTGITTFVYMSF